MVPIIADLVRERGADLVAVQGDSAGAGLALAAVQEVIRRGVESPARVVLISPFLDVTRSDPCSRSRHRQALPLRHQPIPSDGRNAHQMQELRPFTRSGEQYRRLAMAVVQCG
ncbi:alpha/beta hydrolase fold domain-containing protein [Winogradskya consettensis]|uniref:alpha/beta hydrolase fold domain-containing protein n=1 Tax=Winogradskya consettensis TaxID=113560 RepID=UPI001BB40D1D